MGAIGDDRGPWRTLRKFETLRANISLIMCSSSIIDLAPILLEIRAGATLQRRSGVGGGQAASRMF